MSKVYKKLIELTSTELAQELDQTKHQMLNHRFEIVTGHVTNVKLIQKLRRKIAQIKTIQQQRNN